MNLTNYLKAFFVIFLYQSLAGPSSTAQAPKWINYSREYMFKDIDFEGNIVWISTYGGLVKYDKTANTSTILTPANSGLTNGNINNLTIASNGNKWVSTNEGGLQCYNGYTWTNYFNIGSGDTIWHALATDEDPSGNIWIVSAPSPSGGSNSGREIFKFDGSSFTKITLPGTGLMIKDLVCDSSGNVWVGSYSTLFKFDGTTWTDYTPSNSNIEGNPNKIVVDSLGNVWAAINTVNGQFVSKFDGATFTNYLIPYSMGNPISLSVDANNNLLVFGPQGIVNFDGTTFSLVLGAPFASVGFAKRDVTGKIYAGFWNIADTLFYEFDPATSFWRGICTSNSSLIGNYGWDVDIDANNNRWFITDWDLGITKFDGTSWTIYNTSNSGIPSDDLRCLKIANNGDFWFGFETTSPYPIAKWDGTTWEYFDLATIFPSGGGEVLEIDEDQNGNIWAATGGGIARYSSGTWSYFTTANLPVPYNNCFIVKVDKANNVWAYMHTAGLLKYDGSLWTSYTTSNSGIQNNFVSDITFDNNNNLWLIAETKIVQKFDGANWTTYPGTVNGITYPTAFGIEFNEIDNTIWISSMYEFIKYDGLTWERFDYFNSGISTGGRKTAIDSYNNKWFVTWNSGFVVYNENGIDYETIYHLGHQSIKGKVFFDANSNGLLDPPLDHGVSGRKIRLMPDSTITFTGSNGNYIFNRDTGNYETAYLTDPNWFITSDSLSYQVHVDSTDVDSLDFGTLYNGMEDHAIITCVALQDRCNVPGAHLITFRNDGTTVLNGSIRYVCDPLLTFISAIPSPTTVSGDTVIWNYIDLLQYEERQIVANFMNPGPQPGNGGWIISGASITQNQIVLCTDSAFQQITCSFDPNDKQVYPIGVGVNHEILPGDSLTYTVRFQNTGNDTAFFVMVVDTLSSYLDMNTFEFLSSSHDVQVNCAMNGVITFVFDNINLLWSDYNEPASHGYVKFRIKPKNGLSLPVEITNKAFIFFDFNPPIITNTISNHLVNAYTGIIENSDAPEKLLVYPNPSTGNFTVQFFENNPGGNCSIYNATGKLIQSWMISPGQRNTYITGLSSGLYLVNYHSNNGSTVIQKIISQ